MSILIPGKMPTSCWDCPMCYDMIGCSLTGERWWSDSHVYLDFSPGEERMCNCPLIELPPHGRLGDLDKLDDAFTALRFNEDGSLNHWDDRKNWCLHGSEIEMLLANAPTIIPAEGGANDG